LVLKRSLMPRNNEPAEEHLVFVRRIAGKVSRRSRRSSAVDFDDLVQAGTVALLEAKERFDPEYGVSFRSFAKKRVVGAMYDELRRLHRLPPAAVASLDAPPTSVDGHPLAEVVSDPTASAELRIETGNVFPSDRRLTRRHRFVLGRAAAGYRNSEIASMLGVSPSRVGQLLKQARSPSEPVDGKSLSERECEVLAATAEGLTAKEIAKRLVIAPATVQDHRRSATAKLAARNITHAVAVAYEDGLLPLSVDASLKLNRRSS
jgi:RNA polymerase sigma factor (sigma-70 family)